MYRIFLIEDDNALANATKRHIESWGFTVKSVDNFIKVMDQYNEFDPHLTLIDIKLPHFNGYYWCSEIRKTSNAPIIFISSVADNMSLIMAMNMGGDDYIAKPFDANVLMAKIQAVLRRTYDLKEKVNVLENRGLILNLNDFSFIYEGKKIDLTKNEFRILETLMLNSGKIVSREMLMTRLWQNDSYVEENTLTVNVNRLRKLLSGAGIDDFIKTKIGYGYIIES